MVIRPTSDFFSASNFFFFGFLVSFFPDDEERDASDHGRKYGLSRRLKWIGERLGNYFIIWDFNCDCVLFIDSGIGKCLSIGCAFGLAVFFLGRE